MRAVSRPVCGLFILLYLLLPPVVRANEAPLTLREAEQLALESDPLTRRYDALSAAYAEQAVADAQLPDPKISLGVQDIPASSPSFTQDDFTQLSVGVRQAIPPGATLKHRAAQTTALAEAETARAHEQTRRLLNSVRGSWFETYYQARAVDILRASHTLLSQLLQITRTQYSTGLTGAQDLLNAELELRQLKERITATEAAHDTARADLMRWLGQPHTPRTLAEEFSPLALPVERAVIEAHLDEHPLMAAEAAKVRASGSEVSMAREQYRPGWEVDVGYGARGGGRTDYISAGVTLELPIFADKRQDRRLAASEQQASAARYARDDQRRELLHRLESGYAAWTGLGKRLVAYDKEIVPQAAQNAELALKAYQNNSADFASVMRAQLTGQEVRLQALRVRVDHAKAQADLLYFAGEAS
ncbi:MAG: TolC family protein [Gammaproteobacteria bacterium]|nr:TolC family protein [Gammaproteobacteria bacterium]